MRNSAPLWARGQDAFLVIRRSRDRAQLTTQWLFAEGFGNFNSNVTANTRGGFTRNSAPLWARGQDAFLVILGPRVQAQPVTLWFICQRL